MPKFERVIPLLVYEDISAALPDRRSLGKGG
jgi:hypothetical protein